MDRIFRTITKYAATNISLADVQQKIEQMISSSQLQNKSFQGMDSHYVLSSSIQENNSCNFRAAQSKIRYCTSHKGKQLRKDFKGSDHIKICRMLLILS